MAGCRQSADGAFLGCDATRSEAKLSNAKVVDCVIGEKRQNAFITEFISLCWKLVLGITV